MFTQPSLSYNLALLQQLKGERERRERGVRVQKACGSKVQRGGNYQNVIIGFMVHDEFPTVVGLSILRKIAFTSKLNGAAGFFLKKKHFLGYLDFGHCNR